MIRLLVVIAVVLFAWIGVNSVLDQPMFSNPFSEETTLDKVIDSGKDVIDEAKDALD